MSENHRPPEENSVIVEFPNESQEELNSVLSEDQSHFDVISSRMFSAAETFVVVSISIPAIRGALEVLRSHIESKRFVSISFDGVKLDGLKANQAIDVLEHLAEYGTLPERNDK